MKTNFTNFTYELIGSSLPKYHEVCVSFTYQGKNVKRFIYIKDVKDANKQYYIDEAKKRIEVEEASGKLLDYAKSYGGKAIKVKRNSKKGLVIFAIVTTVAAATLAGLFTWQYLTGGGGETPVVSDYSVGVDLKDPPAGYSVSISKNKATPNTKFEAKILLNLSTDWCLPTDKNSVAVTIKNKGSTDFTYEKKTDTEASFVVEASKVTGDIKIKITLDQVQTQTVDVTFIPTSDDHPGHWEVGGTDPKVVPVLKGHTIDKGKVPDNPSPDNLGATFEGWFIPNTTEAVNLTTHEFNGDTTLYAHYSGAEIDPEEFEDHDDPDTTEFKIFSTYYSYDDVQTYKECALNDHFDDESKIVVERGLPDWDPDHIDFVEDVKQRLNSGDSIDAIYVDNEVELLKLLESGIKFRRFDHVLSDVLDKEKDMIYDYQLPFCQKELNEEIHTYAMPTFISPTAFIYRRSVAKEVVGTDDPDGVGNKISSLDDFNATSQGVMDKGKKTLLTYDDNFQLYKGTRTSPWLTANDEKLIFTSASQTVVDNYLGFGRMRYFEKKYDNVLTRWETDWETELKSNDPNYFGFPCPLWLINNIDGIVAGESSYGTWAVTRGPTVTTDGAQYILVPQGSKNPATAAQFVTNLVTDKAEDLCLTVDKKPVRVSVNKTAVTNLANGTASSPLLSGQNPYGIYKQILDSYDSGQSPTGPYFPSLYENNIDSIILNYGKQYFNDEINFLDAQKGIQTDILKLDDRICYE